MRRLVPAVLLVALAFAAVAVALRSVPFTTLDAGSGAGAPFGKQPQGAIRDRATWGRVWRHYHRGEIPADTPPKVDFSRWMLIAVSAGTRSNGGYGLDVERITDDGRRLRMTVNVSAPGDNCVTPQVITAPYAIVRVRRSRKPVVFFRKTTIDYC